MAKMQLNFDAPLEPSFFVGRQNLLDQIFSRLNHSAFLSSSLVGGPQTGKTSMLRYVISEEAVNRCSSAIGLYVDAEPLGGNASAMDFWISLFRAAQKKAPSDALDRALARAKQGNLDIYDLEDVFDHFAETKTPFVVAIDNFEYLLKNQNFWPPNSGFFHDARSLAQRQPRGIAYITSTSRPLLDLWDPTRGASPYYNIFANILVARMTESDVAAIVKSVFAAAGVVPSAAVKTLIAEASDMQPGLVGPVAQFLAARVAAGDAADEESLVPLFEDPNGPYIKLIRQIRTNLQPDERQLLDNLGQQTLTESSKRLLQQLRDYGLLPPGTEC